MKVYKIKSGILLEKEGNFSLALFENWARFINNDNVLAEAEGAFRAGEKLSQEQAAVLLKAELLAPISSDQEVWAAGVTYSRSKQARMEESKESGGSTFYDKVYEAERPELFFKATASRTVGSGARILIRKDASWNVPEPEFTLFITSKGKIVGYTCGNDVSARDIEGENLLYLPQAKVYDRCAALGPCIYLTDQPLNPETTISLEIIRAGQSVFKGDAQLKQMKRSFEQLRDYLFRHNSFENGVFLMTGTCIVPENEFTLAPDDQVIITIESVGQLINWVD